MPNYAGHHTHHTQGDRYKRTSKGLGGSFSIDFSNFEEIASKLEAVDMDLRDAVGEAINEVAKQVQDDVREAVQPPNLPAGGAYSKDQDTEHSIIDNPQVEWSGLIGEVDLGFDKSKPGAGGFLITGRGTPRMEPDKKLEKIFTTKKYLNDFKKKIQQELNKIVERVSK